MDPLTLILAVILLVTIGLWAPVVLFLLLALFGLLAAAGVFVTAFVMDGWDWVVTKITGKTFTQRRVAKVKRKFNAQNR